MHVCTMHDIDHESPPVVCGFRYTENDLEKTMLLLVLIRNACTAFCFHHNKRRLLCVIGECVMNLGVADNFQASYSWKIIKSFRTKTQNSTYGSIEI
jgi:hypothetical protein